MQARSHTVITSQTKLSTDPWLLAISQEANESCKQFGCNSITIIVTVALLCSLLDLAYAIDLFSGYPWDVGLFRVYFSASLLNMVPWWWCWLEHVCRRPTSYLPWLRIPIQWAFHSDLLLVARLTIWSLITLGRTTSIWLMVKIIIFFTRNQLVFQWNEKMDEPL